MRSDRLAVAVGYGRRIAAQVSPSRPHSVAADLAPADFERLYEPNQTRLAQAATQVMEE